MTIRPPYADHDASGFPPDPALRAYASPAPNLFILFLFLIICLADLSGLFSTRLLALEPHPFWIPVLLAAMQHGPAQGVAAAFIATMLQWGFGWEEPAAGADYYHALLHNLREPLLWLLAAGLIGSIGQRQQDRAAALEADAARHETEATALAAHCKALRANVARLEHSVTVSGAANAGRCMELLDELASAPSPLVETVLRDAMAQLLGADGIEIIVFDQGEASSLRDVTSLREATGAQGRQIALQQHSSLPAALRDKLRIERRIFSRADPADGEALAALHAALVVPLPGSGGNILGALLVREIDPACLSPGGEAALSLVSFILGQRLSLGRPMAVEAVEAMAALKEAGRGTGASNISQLPPPASSEDVQDERPEDAYRRA